MPVTHMTTFGALPALRIEADDGAHTTVTLFGAHLVSWQSADGKEQLFCSSRSALDGSRAIRGGVPLIFPQFGEQGAGMRHGFARVCTWRHVDSGTDGAAAYADFALTDQDLPPALAQAWPHAFALRLRVSVCADQLQLCFDVANTGAHAFAFATALHSYLALEPQGPARIAGLRDVRYVDAATPSATAAAAPLAQTETLLCVDAKIDRIYRDVPGPLLLTSGARTLRLEQSGFRDAVVWNPGALDAAALPDMADDDYERFVCIEAALITPAVLEAGARWRGWHRISAGQDTA
ncbi:MAG: D-hexose-6-phosphate mutarotase [Pseudomonadota bacterium]